MASPLREPVAEWATSNLATKARLAADGSITFEATDTPTSQPDPEPSEVLESEPESAQPPTSYLYGGSDNFPDPADGELGYKILKNEPCSPMYPTFDVEFIGDYLDWETAHDLYAPRNPHFEKMQALAILIAERCDTPYQPPETEDDEDTEDDEETEDRGPTEEDKRNREAWNSLARQIQTLQRKADAWTGELGRLVKMLNDRYNIRYALHPDLVHFHMMDNGYE